jgi:hypothetical protein
MGISARAFAAAMHQSDEIRRTAAVRNNWLLVQSQQLNPRATKEEASVASREWMTMPILRRATLPDATHPSAA